MTDSLGIVTNLKEKFFFKKVLGGGKVCNTSESQHIVDFYILSLPKTEQAKWGHNCIRLVSHLESCFSV